MVSYVRKIGRVEQKQKPDIKTKLSIAYPYIGRGGRNKVLPGINLRKLSRDCGVHLSYLQRVISDQQNPSLKASMRIADKLELNLDSLIKWLQSEKENYNHLQKQIQKRKNQNADSYQ